MRPALAWAATVLAVAAAAAAQPADDLPAEHSFVVEGATMGILETVDTQTMEEVVEPLCADDNPVDVIEVAADGSSFTFEERPAEAGASGVEQPYTGCAGMRSVITFPAVIEKLRVNFTADRQVELESLSGNSNNPPDLVQEFHIIFPDGSRRVDPYFASDDGSAPPRVIDREYQMPPGTREVELLWFFQDEGFGFIEFFGDPGRARLRSTVSDIQLHATGITLPEPAVSIGPEVLGETTGRIEYWVNTSVPPDAVRPLSASKVAGDRSAEIALEIRRGPQLLDRFGPKGVLENTSFAAARIGDRIVFTVDAGTVAQQGHGIYAFHFATVRALPPPQEPGPPTRIQPFYYTMMALPAPAALLALYSGIVYRREAEGRYRRPAVGILVGIAIGILYYVLLVLFAVFSVGRQKMTTLPLDSEATLVYIQLIVLLLFFAVAAVVVGRYLARAMRRDIETRRLQEEKLRRSNEELERFAYVASHDLQEPLRKVAGFTSLLQRRYKGRLDKDADEMIQYAVDGATRMQALIRDILAYSRVGSSELDPKPVELGSLMELVASDLSEKIKDEKAQVTWAGLPTVEADAGQMRQVLQNLVENGLKYRHPTRRPRIRVSAEPDGAWWRVAVADNGVGIPADKLGEIFGIFRRLHGNDVPGTGIGLALAKKAVERHGGKIWAESREGRGSTFYFTVPAAATARPWPLPAPADDSPRTGAAGS